jgi:hypothetical protein
MAEFDPVRASASLLAQGGGKEFREIVARLLARTLPDMQRRLSCLGTGPRSRISIGAPSSGMA